MTVVVFLSSLLGFMTLGMPIAFALLLTGSVLMWYLDFWDVQLLAQNLLAGADSFPLLAVPFFLLSGHLMARSGIAPYRVLDPIRWLLSRHGVFAQEVS